ncbi:MAG: hypothetical protein MUP16_10695, partial [Sedimentisphaerales bacterium]|nr:hypothetical protein [Sedimentisphaerales bacterium]
MNKHNKNLINVIATGFVVLILFLLVLFWVRLFFLGKLINDLPEEYFDVIIMPSGLVPGEPAPQQVKSLARPQIEPPGPNEPNFIFSQVYASINTEIVIGSAIGALRDIMAEVIPYRDVNERVYYYWYDEGKDYLCLDNRSGLIIRHYEYFNPDDKSTSRKEDFFAGSNGISEMPSDSLGRFYDPIIAWAPYSEIVPSRIVLYDKKMHRFYIADFGRGNVDKGLQLAEGDSREPIAMGSIGKGFNRANVIWNSPLIRKVGIKCEPQRLLLSSGDQLGEGYFCTGFDRTD